MCAISMWWHSCVQRIRIITEEKLLNVLEVGTGGFHLRVMVKILRFEKHNIKEDLTLFGDLFLDCTILSELPLYHPKSCSD